MAVLHDSATSFIHSPNQFPGCARPISARKFVQKKYFNYSNRYFVFATNT